MKKQKEATSTYERHLPEHERAEYALHRQKLSGEIEPISTLEHDLFEQLLAVSWNLRRYRRLEDEIFQNEANPLANEFTAKALDRLNKYRVSAERSYHRTLKAIKEIQTNYILRADLPESTRNLISGLVDMEKVRKYLLKRPQSNKTKPNPYQNYVFNSNEYPPCPAENEEAGAVDDMEDVPEAA